MRAASLVLAITLLGCTPVEHTIPACAFGNDGIAIAAWTVRGQPASAQSCTGIDHLELTVIPDRCDGATIEPVPCDAGRIRYDGLPRGPAQLVLDAVDASRTIVLEGVTRFDLEPNPQAAPAQLDLR